MTGNGQPLRSRTPSRSWTPLSRADRNRLRRGEEVRVSLWKSTRLSDAWGRYRDKVVPRG